MNDMTTAKQRSEQSAEQADDGTHGLSTGSFDLIDFSFVLAHVT